MKLIRRAPLGDRMIEIDQHDDPKFRRNTGERNKTDGGGNREVVAEHEQQPETAHQREGQSAHDQRRGCETSEGQIEEYKDDDQRERHDELQLLGRALQVLELSGPGNRISRWQVDALTHELLGLYDIPP